MIEVYVVWVFDDVEMLVFGDDLFDCGVCVGVCVVDVDEVFLVLECLGVDVF